MTEHDQAAQSQDTSKTDAGTPEMIAIRQALDLLQHQATEIAELKRAVHDLQGRPTTLPADVDLKAISACAKDLAELRALCNRRFGL